MNTTKKKSKKVPCMNKADKYNKQVTDDMRKRTEKFVRAVVAKKFDDWLDGK